MLIRFFGFKYADPREFVEMPVSWWGGASETIYTNDFDSYISYKTKIFNKSATLEAVVQRVFNLESFYRTFLDFEGVAVYVFPNSKALTDQCRDDFNVFQKCLNESRRQTKTLLVFNSWNRPKEGFTLNKGEIESKLGFEIPFETCLGKREDVNQQESFLDLMRNII